MMTNLVKLNFEVTVECHEECANDLGKDLARWLRESWFNGEDVLDVEFIDYKVVLLMFDDFGWLVVFIAILFVVLFALELWVIIVISGTLASYFGFSGVLWWVCSFMMFVLINGFIGAVWNMR